MIACDAVVRRYRELHGSSDCSTVNRTYQRRAHLVNRIEQHLSVMTETLRVCCGFQLQKLIDVCPCNPAVLLSAEKDSSANIQIAIQSIEQRDELILEPTIE